MTRAYLDWAASAPLHPAARHAVDRVLTVGAGNPSSVHREGRAAKAILEEARAAVARLAGVSPSEVLFTSSGSEANAAAILGVARSRAATARRLLVGALEHPSVHLAAESARAFGAEPATLPASPSGVIDCEGVSFDADVCAVAIQLANNETGALQPVAALAAAAREAGAHLHCDAVQAAGKVDLPDVAARCHSLAISAHKLGGLAGAGALILRRGVELPALLPGHQERGRRGGSHSLAAIAAFGAVAAVAVDEAEQRRAHLADRGLRLEAIVREASSEVWIQAGEVPRVGGIVSATFPGVDGETLLVALDLAGVATAHGAACSTGAMEPSHVLLAMGLSPALARSTLRFSVGVDTTDDELALLAEVLPKAVRASRI